MLLLSGLVVGAFSARTYGFGAVAVFLDLAAVILVFEGLTQFVRLSNRRRRIKREAEWMAGVTTLQRTADRPGMTVAELEDFLARVRNAGAAGGEIVRAMTFLRGGGIEEISVKISAGVTVTPEPDQ